MKLSQAQFAMRFGLRAKTVQEGGHAPIRSLRASLIWRLRLGDKDGNLTFRARLIFRVWWVCRHGQCPQTAPFLGILDLTHAHRAYDGLIAKLDMRIGAQIVDPRRIFSARLPATRRECSYRLP